MAKRAPAARAFVHVMRPNKKKAAGPVKRARKSAKRAGKTFARARAGKTRTVIRLVAKSPLATGRVAGRGIAGVTNAIPPRKRTVVLRSAGGRFAGRKSV